MDDLSTEPAPGHRVPRRVLAVSSGGGHWVQLLRLRPAFAGCRVAYVTVHRSYAADLTAADLSHGRFYAVPDATRWDRVRLARLALRMAWIVLRERPHVVVSTGSAPGYFGVRFAQRLGARALWLDSIANTERVSMAGEMLLSRVDTMLTQWSHLARDGGPLYGGSTL